MPNPVLVPTRAAASGTGCVRAGGTERDVTFAKADDAVQAGVDAAYHAEYDLTDRAGIVGMPSVPSTRSLSPS
jgi:hypothetical protein